MEQERALRDRARQHVWMHTVPWSELETPQGLKVMERGQGARLIDAEGRSYLDGTSGLWLVNVGWGREEIAKAMYEQASKLHYVRPSGHTTMPALQLAERLAMLAPGDIDSCFFVSSGSEANETALKIARQYHYLRGEAKRSKVISRRFSYHGSTAGALSLTTSPLADRRPFEPLLPGMLHVSPPYCYRCDFGMRYPSCGVHCASSIEQVIQLEKPDTIAMLIAEPISNSCGVAVPPDEYWPMLRELCDRYGILLVADEVITGFGRTGKMFACEHWGVVPDIITVAKGLSSGYAPVGAALVRRPIAEAFRPGYGEMLQHVATFGGHPVAAAAALANLEIIERENLVEHAATVGRLLLDGLRELEQRHPCVGDVRGLGLMCSLELVGNKLTAEPLSNEQRIQLRKLLAAKLDAAGVILWVMPGAGAGEVIPVMPPLIVTRWDIDELLEVLDRCLSEVEAELGFWKAQPAGQSTRVVARPTITSASR